MAHRLLHADVEDAEIAHPLRGIAVQSLRRDPVCDHLAPGGLHQPMVTQKGWPVGSSRPTQNCASCCGSAQSTVTDQSLPNAMAPSLSVSRAATYLPEQTPRMASGVTARFPLPRRPAAHPLGARPGERHRGRRPVLGELIEPSLAVGRVGVAPPGGSVDRTAAGGSARHSCPGDGSPKSSLTFFRCFDIDLKSK